MTTIAYRYQQDGTLLLASDSLASSEWGVETGEKIYFLNETDLRLVLAFSGKIAAKSQVLEWLGRQRRKSGKVLLSGFPREEKDFYAVVFGKNGHVEIYGGDATMEFPSNNLAFGSGGNFALGAMDAGLSPADAIRLVIQKQRDVYTGGEVHSYTINPNDLSEIIIDRPSHSEEMAAQYRDPIANSTEDAPGAS